MLNASLHAVRPPMAVSDVAEGGNDLGSYIAGTAMNGCIERRSTCPVGAVCRVTTDQSHNYGQFTITMSSSKRLQRDCRLINSRLNAQYWPSYRFDKKSYMSFGLVQKSVTLNDLERRNGPYFALFHRICV